MGRVRKRDRVAEAGFTLVEMLISMAIVGVFLGMVGGVVIGSTNLARKQQELTAGRSNSRFALGFISTEIASAGHREPLVPPFIALDTLNDVDDADVADLGTDTFTVVRARTGSRTLIQAQTGNVDAGTILVGYHHEDTTGDSPICPTAAACLASFTPEYGGDDDFLMIGTDTTWWIVQLTAAPTVQTGPGGGFTLTYSGIRNNTGGGAFQIGATVMGIVVRSFRVVDETLEMKEGLVDSEGDFFGLATGIEDLQLAWILADGTFVNDGIPATENIRATVVTLVNIQPPDMSVGLNFFRPAVEDHEEGLVFDRRRRKVSRQLIWGRNLG